MPEPFYLIVTPTFTDKFAEKQPEAKAALRRALAALAQNPRHKSLRCRPVMGAKERLFEARSTRGDRFVWAYGAQPRTIELRNACDHELTGTFGKRRRKVGG